MAGQNELPTYNLKAVVKETGIKPDTLRAWERRYGLPQPQRSLGGHRLFSRRDIDTIEWLMEREKEGLSISRAVGLWRSLEAEGRDPLLHRSALTSAGARPARPLPSFTEGREMAELRKAWVEACLAFDERRAEQVLSQAFALYSPEVVSLELLRKGVVQAGEGWCRGETAVQQEYFASELARRRLQALMVAMAPPTRLGRILVATAPGESSTLNALILSFLLRRRGFDVLYLGGNISLSGLEATLSGSSPRLIVLLAHTLPAAANLLEVAEAVHPGETRLGFGGAVFTFSPGLRDRIPGYFLGEDLEETVAAVEHLASMKPAPRALPVLSEDYRKALAQFRKEQASIEADVWRAMELRPGQEKRLSIANERLGENILAALRLGDLGLLGNDIDWVQCLLDSHCFEAEQLRAYLAAYQRASEVHLHDEGRLIVDWLASLNVTALKQPLQEVEPVLSGNGGQKRDVA